MKRKLVICCFGSTGRDSDLNLESYWPSFRDHVYQFLVNLLGRLGEEHPKFLPSWSMNSSRGDRKKTNHFLATQVALMGRLSRQDWWLAVGASGALMGRLRGCDFLVEWSEMLCSRKVRSERWKEWTIQNPQDKRVPGGRKANQRLGEKQGVAWGPASGKLA